jgi:MoaA/NifB/PqqE/SkfB family radical SAM enzyme
LAGLRKAAAYGINIQVSCLIMQQNKEDLIGIIELVRSLGITDFYFSIPCIAKKDIPYYIPLKNLGKYVKLAYNYSNKIGYPVTFMEIPFCVFEAYDDNIKNSCRPPNLGKYCQPPPQFRSKVKNMPSYRIKEKTKICQECLCNKICDGFFKNDIKKFGLGDLSPIKEIINNKDN